MIHKQIFKLAEEFRPLIVSASQNSGVFSISLIAGVIHEESMFGLLLTPKGPAGVGDNGHGRGLMQIDDRYHEFARTGNWRDPLENIMYGVSLLKSDYEALRRNAEVPGDLVLRATLAAYNTGLNDVLSAIRRGVDVDIPTSKDRDSGTAGGDYSQDVLKNAQDFLNNGWI